MQSTNPNAQLNPTISSLFQPLLRLQPVRMAGNIFWYWLQILIELGADMGQKVVHAEWSHKNFVPRWPFWTNMNFDFELQNQPMPTECGIPWVRNPSTKSWLDGLVRRSGKNKDLHVDPPQPFNWALTWRWPFPGALGQEKRIGGTMVLTTGNPIRCVEFDGWNM